MITRIRKEATLAETKMPIWLPSKYPNFLDRDNTTLILKIKIELRGALIPIPKEKLSWMICKILRKLILDLAIMIQPLEVRNIELNQLHVLGDPIEDLLMKMKKLLDRLNITMKKLTLWIVPQGSQSPKQLERMNFWQSILKTQDRAVMIQIWFKWKKNLRIIK